MSDRLSAFGPDMEQICIVDQRVREAMTSGRVVDARRMALERACGAVSDLAMATMAAGDLDQALRELQLAQNLHPADQTVFHNLVAALLARGQLRDSNLESVRMQLLRLGDKPPWTQGYRPLLYAPSFMNLELVLGKCNLACRMCIGGKNRSGRLEYMSTDDFDRALAAAPTVSGLTLSSGDSDPLLHPDFEQLVDIAARHKVTFSAYTNGLPLGSRKCRKIVASQVVTMLNFSIDAATPETYRAIRGEDLQRVLNKIEMLRSMKAELKAEMPVISLSFVAMADNVAELPGFIELADRSGAARVYVEDLIGWDDPAGPNQPATNNPRCADFVRQAVELAADKNLDLELPGRLRPSKPDDAVVTTDAAPANPRLRCCSWLGGVWVQKDGRLDPCCLLHNVADMGRAQDGPILKNENFCRVKNLLLSGKVLPECVHQRACRYVQQQLAAGIPLQVAALDEPACASY